MLGVGLAVVALTFRDFGPTYDEAVQAGLGELALGYFESGGEDRTFEAPPPPLPDDLHLYGPLVEMIPALFYEGESPAKYHTRHLYLGLLSLASVVAVWLYGKRFGDARVALFSVLIVATLPRLYGHAFINSKDIPFALSVIWFLWSLAALFADSRLRASRLVVCGIALGLGLCARPGGMPLFAMFLFGAALIWLVTRERGPGEPSHVRAALALAPRMLVVLAIAWPIMVAPWPWAHGGPIGRPLEAMKAATQFHTTVPILFEGRTINSDALPWYYIPKYVLMVTPLAVLALAMVGLFGGAFDLLARRAQSARMTLLTGMWLFAPLALFAVLRPNVYGGMRHFLFVLPALGILAGSGAAWLLRPVLGTTPRRIAWIVLLFVAALPVKDLVRLHPYQMTYHNALVGGVRGASENYWTDYSLTSYAEAIAWVNERASAEPNRQFSVVIGAGPAILMWADAFAAENVELISLRTLDPERTQLAPADYFIATSRGGLIDVFDEAPVVHSIGRDGAVFTVIKEPEPAG